LPLTPQLESASNVFVVGLIASADRISQVRRNRVMSLADRDLNEYVDRDVIEEEITYTRRLCSRNGWPVIDVTRRSVEETAAAILKHYQNRNENTAGI
jgi:regulator of PEP synthase PpsR (kinase-PPPase family)